MIEIHISETGKSRPRDSYSCFDKERICCGSMAEAKTLLAERYGKFWKHKKPIFQDVKASPNDTGFSKTVRVGWVIGFRNADWSHSPVDHWLQQDWVSFSECNPVILGDA